MRTIFLFSYLQCWLLGELYVAISFYWYCTIFKLDIQTAFVIYLCHVRSTVICDITKTGQNLGVERCCHDKTISQEPILDFKTTHRFSECYGMLQFIRKAHTHTHKQGTAHTHTHTQGTAVHGRVPGLQYGFGHTVVLCPKMECSAFEKSMSKS